MADEAVEQAIQHAMSKAPELTTGGGVATTLATWLSQDTSFFTNCAAVIGAFTAIAGLVWMIYRDTRLNRKPQ